MNGVIGFVIGRFQLTFGLEAGIGTMVEKAVGQGAAEPLMKKQENQSHLGSFRSEAVGIASTIALEQAMAFEFAQIIAELVEGIGWRGELVGLEHRL